MSSSNNLNLMFLKDFWWTFLLPFICFCSLITNILNIIVLYDLKTKSKIYKYMLLKSILNSVYLFIYFFIFLFKCGQFCKSESSFVVLAYQQYIFFYVSNVLSLFDLFIELIISFSRYLTISSINKRIVLKNIKMNSVILGCFVFCCLTYSPFLFYSFINDTSIQEIINGFNRTLNLFENTTSNFNLKDLDDSNSYFEYDSNNSLLTKVFQPIWLVIRGILLTFLITFININFRKLKTNVNDVIIMRKTNRYRLCKFFFCLN
jgi:hypothetical protein